MDREQPHKGDTLMHSVTVTTVANGYLLNKQFILEHGQTVRTHGGIAEFIAHRANVEYTDVVEEVLAEQAMFLVEWQGWQPDENVCMCAQEQLEEAAIETLDDDAVYNRAMRYAEQRGVAVYFSK